MHSAMTASYWQQQPTMGMSSHLCEFIESLTERNYQKRTIGLIENGSWAATAAKVMRQLFEKSKEITFTETTVKIMSALNEESTTQLEKLAEELCK